MNTGVYRHYKGGHYLVLGTAHDANADDTLSNHGGMGSDGTVLGEREVVVYVRLYERDGLPMAVRTVEDFNQKLCSVTWEDDQGERVFGCYRPLDENDRCPDHGHTNTRTLRRFTPVSRIDVHD